MAIVGRRGYQPTSGGPNYTLRATRNGRPEDSPSAAVHTETKLFVDSAQTELNGTIFRSVAAFDRVGILEAARRIAAEAGIDLGGAGTYNRRGRGKSKANGHANSYANGHADEHASGHSNGSTHHAEPDDGADDFGGDDVDEFTKAAASFTPKDHATIAKAQGIWASAQHQSIRDTPAESYLNARAIRLTTEEPWLRCNEADPLWGWGERYPVVIAAATLGGVGDVQGSESSARRAG